MSTPIIDPAILHLDHTPACGCGCHTEKVQDASPAVYGLNFHGCAAMLRCRACAWHLQRVFTDALIEGVLLSGTCCEKDFGDLDAFMEVVTLR